MAKQTSPRTSSPATKRKASSEAPAPITKVVAKAPMPLSAVPAEAPSHEQIAARAFELYQLRGGSNGTDLSDWLRAERELRS